MFWLPTLPGTIVFQLTLSCRKYQTLFSMAVIKEIFIQALFSWNLAFRNYTAPGNALNVKFTSCVTPSHRRKFHFVKAREQSWNMLFHSDATAKNSQGSKPPLEQPTRRRHKVARYGCNSLWCPFIHIDSPDRRFCTCSEEVSRTMQRHIVGNWSWTEIRVIRGRSRGVKEEIPPPFFCRWVWLKDNSCTCIGVIQIQPYHTDRARIAITLYSYHRPTHLTFHFNHLPFQNPGSTDHPSRLFAATFGLRKAAALPAFHALSGTDNAGKGKAACWKIIQDASEEIINAQTNLGTNEKPTEWLELSNLFANYTCKTKMSNDLRWWLFKKKQAKI